VSPSRLLMWRGLDEWRTEAAEIELGEDGVEARGTQIGLDPLPYRLNYRLEAPERFVTRSLELESSGEGWRRELRLTHDGNGSWQAEGSSNGEVDLPGPGGDTAGLGDALDCDLGFSPLTNFMPLRRHELHRGPGEAECVMAWVSVPDLALHVSPQRYEHVRKNADGAVVRFIDKGLFEGFTSELELDGDGLVRLYPGLAARVGPDQRP
jgi:hypothetical protein